MGSETLIELLDEEDDHIAAQVKAFLRSDAERNQLIKKLCHENQALKEELRQKSADFDAELEARRSWQSQAEKIDRLLEHTQKSTQSQNYVLVAIDGNSCVFQEAYMWNGASGGAAAADKLYLAVQTHFEHLDAGRARQWKIVVRVYLDVYGLFQRLRVAGYSHDLERLYQFARGFTQRQSLFDLVDVGHGSQQVPIKMEELFGIYINSAQCQQVLVGCHGDDLSTIFGQHRVDTPGMKRITLLRASESKTGPPFPFFGNAEFPSVFRSSPLPAGTSHITASMVSNDDLGQSAPQNWNNGHLLSESSSPKKSLESSYSFVTNSRYMPSPKPIINGHSPSSSQATPNGHYQLDDAVDDPSSLTTKTWRPRQNVLLLNSNDERVDSNLGQLDADAAARVTERTDKKKLCNDFHLRGQCRTAACTFAHEPTLDDKELVVLKYKARFLVCEKGSACRIPDCWHGHMCSFQDCRRVEICRFKAFHHIDKTAVTVRHVSEPKKIIG
ncbi:hypothetical protein MMC07_009402 [Pseudocyphellaria aurata]|nr:hypothetical protein [Pseudocyphellaria aurata]